jgi:hypothetical protein
MRTNHNNFATIKIEGALLPSDFLQKIICRDKEIEGLTPESYHLAPSEKLNEAINRSWNRLVGLWTSFKTAVDKLPEKDYGTSLTRERWLLPFFQELGYGRLPSCHTVEIDGKSYSISHMWQNTPIHLIGCKLDIEHRTPGAVGASRSSPHSLLQEFLNRTEKHLWGFVSNGYQFRILRDNLSFTRQAYVEFDLQSMMEGEVYSDFTLLWLLSHQSRVESDRPEQCWLEKWFQGSKQQGMRILHHLRDGVEEAINALGAGFLSCKLNPELRNKLKNGQLSAQNYYRQLLRLVYRLLFIFVAEDRGLLLDPHASSDVRDRYTHYYSMARLRRLAGKHRGSPHGDLWQCLSLIFERLSSDEGCPELALPALGSFLWSSESMPDIASCHLANSNLLQAIRAISFTVDGNVRRIIDYKNLGSEELGSIYESLLELHPEIDTNAASFHLNTAAGHERKTTGSYYTPSSLVQCLLESALDPVLDEAVKKENPEKAILNLKICDPACGSGHFLIAAAHRIAKRLATVRTGEEESPPEAQHKALRDVISHCIYGVDINPMSVELCKISLWMDAIEPGKPLSFLDHHIKCGNSLLGVTPALLERGIPDKAFEPIEGDDKKICQVCKKRNKEERQGQEMMLFKDDTVYPWDHLGNLTAGIVNLETINDDTINGIHQRQRRYEEYVHSAGYEYGQLLADLWGAAFVIRKTSEIPYLITETVFRRVEKTAHDIDPWMKAAVIDLARQYQFFHWHLEFPDVFRIPAKDEKPDNAQTGWIGGFDCVLGNPPWERIKLQEKEWFAERRPDIANAPNAAARRKMIAALEKDDPPLFKVFLDDCRRAEGESHFIRNSDCYPFCGRGDINTYSIFAELNRNLINPTGRVGCIVPSGIATDDTTKLFFQNLVEKQSLVSLYEFENEGFFSDAGQGHMLRFALTTICGQLGRARATDFVFQAKAVSDLANAELHFALSASDIALLNPNTRTCPIFRSQRDAELTKYIYRRVPVLIKEGPQEENPWEIKFMAMFHMANDSHLFRTRDQLEAEGFTLEGNTFRNGKEIYLPLFESKMVYQFNHRYGDFSEGDPQKRSHVLNEVSAQRLLDPFYSAQPFYWVNERNVKERLGNDFKKTCLLGWRDVTDARASARTAISSIIPMSAAGDTWLLMFPKLPIADSVLLITCLNSFVCDYITRQKVGGLHLKYHYFKQLTVFPPRHYQQKCLWSSSSLILQNWVLPRVLELIYTAWDMEPFAQDCGYDGPSFKWDEERRFLIRCELDAAFFHLYLGSEEEWKRSVSLELLKYFPTPRDAADYILDTFPIVRRKDEQAWGEYRSKRVILEIYDALQQAIRTGKPYQSRLTPLPGPLCDAEGKFIPMEEWDYTHWPIHIHPPKEALEVPDDIDIAAMDENQYPGSDMDQFVCSAALEIINQRSGMRSTDIHDALLIASHPNWCRPFLTGSNIQKFERAIASGPQDLFVDKGQSINWDDCRNYLEKREAITVAHANLPDQPVTAGKDLSKVKDDFSQNMAELIRLVLRALDQVNSLRQNVAQASEKQRDIIRIIDRVA